MKSDSKYLILVLFFIVLLSFFAYNNFRNFSKGLRGNSSLPDFEMPSLSLETSPLSSIDEGTKEFVASDGKLKLSCPSDWNETDQALLDQFNQAEAGLTKAKSLLFAYKFQINNPRPAFLIVQEVDLDNFNDILEETEKDFEEKGIDIEIFNIESFEKSSSLEIIYQKDDNYNFHSKEKIFFTEGKTYIVTIFTPEETWNSLSEEIEDILNSIEIFS